MSDFSAALDTSELIRRRQSGDQHVDAHWQPLFYPTMAQPIEVKVAIPEDMYQAWKEYMQQRAHEVKGEWREVDDA